MAKAKIKKIKQPMKQKEKPKIKKGGKKGFYEVKAPLVSAKISLYGAGAESFDGKIVKLDLSRSLKGKSFEFKLKITAKGDNLTAEPVSLNLVNSYIRRVMRKGTDYVEDSFVGECKDTKVKIKPFLITRRRVSRAVRRALRETSRKHLEGYLKTRSSKEIFSEIMANKLQKQLFAKLKKVYPLSLCEIRRFEIMK